MTLESLPGAHQAGGSEVPAGQRLGDGDDNPVPVWLWLDSTKIQHIVLSQCWGWGGLCQAADRVTGNSGPLLSDTQNQPPFAPMASLDWKFCVYLEPS